MKTKFNTYRLFFAATVVAGLAIAFSSCHKDDSNNSNSSAQITESQAAQATLDAVNPATGGMASQVGASAAMFSSASVSGGTVSSVNASPLAINDASYTLTCGQVKDSTVSYASVNTTAPAFTYSVSWENTLTCAVPSTFSCNFAAKGTYTGFVLNSSFNSSGSFVISGLGTAAADYTYNSNYSRQGTINSLVGNKNTFTHSLTITSSNILYSKSSQEIVSGTATVSIKVTSTSGNSWTYGGTLTFLGNHTAKLVLNSGTVYNLSWTTTGS